MKRVLLIKRGAIGDVLLSTPLMRQLKRKINCHLSVIVGNTAGKVIENNPYIDDIRVYNDEDFRLRGFFKLIKNFLKLRGRYDYVFVLDKHWYFNLMGKVIGGKGVGYYRSFLTKMVGLNYQVHYFDISRYHVDYYLDLLKVSKLAIPNYEDIDLDISISNEDKDIVDNYLQSKEIKDFVVVVNSGGNNAYESDGIRMLPKELIIDLLQKLILLDSKIILLGSNVDKENYLDYQNTIDNVKLINSAGQFSLAQSTYLISKSNHFYTTDCGAMHLGVCAKMCEKMTAYFGPTNPSHFLPEKYVNRCSVWEDNDIYTPDYLLRGIKPKNRKFFRNIKI